MINMAKRYRKIMAKGGFAPNKYDIFVVLGINPNKVAAIKAKIITLKFIDHQKQ